MGLINYPRRDNKKITTSDYLILQSMYGIYGQVGIVSVEEEKTREKREKKRNRGNQVVGPVQTRFNSSPPSVLRPISSLSVCVVYKHTSIYQVGQVGMRALHSKNLWYSLYRHRNQRYCNVNNNVKREQRLSSTLYAFSIKGEDSRSLKLVIRELAS